MSSIKPPTRRELQRLDTERAVLDAALAAFRAHGFDATTTKQIAEAAGVAAGTVFLVAPTKEALLVRLLETKLREVFSARNASLPKHDVARQLRHVFDGLFEFYAAEPQLSRVFLKGVMFYADAIAQKTYEDHVAGLSLYLTRLFDAAHARGEIARHVDSAVAAANVLALYVYVVVAFLNGNPPSRAALGKPFRAGLDAMARGWAP